MDNSTSQNQKNIFKYTVTFLIIIVLGIILSNITINIKSYYIYIKYTVNSKINPINIEKQINLTAKANQNNELKNKIYIPKISLNSEIIWDEPENSFFNNLKNGITQLANSGHPNENNKNIILGGLSSYPLWSNLPNSSDFVLLNKLEIGDRININYENNNYVYQVIQLQNSYEKELNISAPIANKKLLTLFTYYPYGLNTHKLVINCQQIYSSDKSFSTEL